MPQTSFASCLLAIMLLLPILHTHAADNSPAPKKQPQLIDVTDADMLRTRRPLLIAHRGGVVAPRSPECSAAAMRLAAAAGYDMVELDVRTSKDGVPIVFHDRDLSKACGIDGRIQELPAAEIVKIRYRGTAQTILTLDEALRQCKALSLGVMFDIKQAGEPALEMIVQLTRKHGLQKSAVTINGDPTIQKHLKAVSRIRLLSVEQADMLRKANRGERPLGGYFWFGLPKNIPLDRIKQLQQQGALIFPGINTFRYRKDKHLELAERDIKKLRAAGVDGFQIDSVYRRYFK